MTDYNTRMTAPVYLDHHATTPVDPRVLDAMWPWFAERVGNAASTSHTAGRAARAAVEAARAQVANLIGASPQEICFTSGATEANNLALKGLFPPSTRGRVVTNVAEHRAILDPVRRLRRQGIDVVLLPVDHAARIDLQQLEEALTADTRLVTTMWANNEVGTLQPLDEIGAICRERNIWLHSDAAQAIGRVPVHVATGPIDLLSLSAHKLYGPQGIGALYIRKQDPSIRLTPQLDGGGHEHGLRSGTLPVALIVGFGEACRLAQQELAQDMVRIGGLRDRLQQQLVSQLRDVTVNGHPRERLPGNLHVGFGGLDGDALLSRLDGLAVSSGSACTSADPEPSHVLRAMGVSDSLARSSLRFGIGRFNSLADIDRAAEIVIAAVKALRAG